MDKAGGNLSEDKEEHEEREEALTLEQVTDSAKDLL